MSQIFKNIDTNEKVKILEVDKVFYTLDSGTKIDQNLFRQKYVPVMDIQQPQNIQQPQQNTQQSKSEVIDPNEFLNMKTVITNVNSLKKTNTQNITDIPNQTVKENVSVDGLGSHQIDINNEEAINNLIKPVQPTKQVNENGLTTEQEYIRTQQIELNGIDPFKDRIIKYRLENGIHNQTQQSQLSQSQTQQPMNNQIIEEKEEVKMFKKFKRIHPVKIDLSISDKIAKPQIIELLADGIEGDIIEYYTDEIFNTFVSDIDKLKENIYNQIYKIVYGEDRKIKEKRIEEESINGVELIKGKMTKTGKQQYKFINTDGNIIDCLIETAEKKGYKPVKK